MACLRLPQAISHPQQQFLLCFSFTAAVLLAMPVASAATATWTGGGGDAKWTTGANWGGVAPTANDDLVFPAAPAALTTVNDFPAGTAFASVSIANAGYAFSGNALRLTTGVTTTFAAGTLALPMAVGLPANAALVIGTGGTLQLLGVLSDGAGSGGLTKSGGGTLELGAVNTYTGATLVYDGTLRLGSGGGAAISGQLTIGDGIGAPGSAVVVYGAASQLAPSSAVTIRGDGSLQLNGYDQTLLAMLDLVGGDVATGAGQLTFDQESPDVSLRATSTTVDGATRAASVSGNVRLGSTSPISWLGGFEILRGPHPVDLDLSATITGGNLKRPGGGTLQFSGATGDNTFYALYAMDGLTLLAKTGHLAVRELTVGADVDLGTAGIVRFLASDQLDPSRLLHIWRRGVLDLNGFNQTVDEVTFQGGLLTTGNGTLTLRSSASSSLFMEETGVLRGNIDLNGGEVHFLLGKFLPAGTPEIVVEGTMTHGSVTVGLYPTAIFVGLLDLRGTQSYTGDTRIEAGILAVNGNLAAAVIVTPNRTNPDTGELYPGQLQGTGRIGGTVTTSGGTITAGNSPGILHTGSLTLDRTATFTVELTGPTVGTQYDQLDVTGAVNLGEASLQVSLGYFPAAGTAFTIIRNDGVDPVVGTFAGLPEGAMLQADNVDFVISYRGGDGNDVVLTTKADTPEAVPTLGSWTLAATALLLLASAWVRLRSGRERINWG